MVAFVPEKGTRQHAESCEITAPQIHDPHRGEDARARHDSKEEHAKEKDQKRIVGHHREGYFEETQIMHKDFVALVPLMPAQGAGYRGGSFL